LVNLCIVFACIVPVVALESWTQNWRPTLAEVLRYMKISLNQDVTSSYSHKAPSSPSASERKELIR
jgi:hypothetical protein